jgi:hypothetical protein
MMSCPTSLSTMIASLGPAQMTGLNVPRNDQASNGGGGHSQGPPALAMWLSRAYHSDCSTSRCAATCRVRMGSAKIGRSISSPLYQ